MSNDPPQWPPPEPEQPWQSGWQAPQPGDPLQQGPQQPPQEGWQAPQQPQWQQPAFGQPAAPNSGKATAALVLGICGIVVCPIILSVLALVFGYQARAEIDNSGGRVGGRGQAVAGIILGWIGIVIYGLLLVLFLVGMSTFDIDDDSGDFQSFPVSVIRAAAALALAF